MCKIHLSKIVVLTSLALMIGCYMLLNQIEVMAQTPIFQVSANVPLYDVAWSPDGTVLAASGEDGIRLYTDQLQETSYVTASRDNVMEVSWSPDSSRLASYNLNDNTVQIWQRNMSTNDLVLLDTLQPLHEAVGSVAWSPVDQKLAILVLDQPEGFNAVLGAIEIWGEANSIWRLEKSLIPDRDNIFPGDSLVWNGDGTLLAGVGNGCRIEECSNGFPSFVYTVDVNTGKTLSKYEFIVPPFSLAWSINDELAIGEHKLIVVNPVAVQEISQWESVDVNAGALHIDWSSDGRKMVLGSESNGLISIIDPNTLTLIQSFSSTAQVTELDWSPDDRKLATINNDDMIEIWDTTNLPAVSGSPIVTPLEIPFVDTTLSPNSSQ